LSALPSAFGFSSGRVSSWEDVSAA
jgi:hypothetical protein